MKDPQNHNYRLRITPYRTMDSRIEGVVLAFLDSLNPKCSSAAATPKRRGAKGFGGDRNKR